MLKKQSQILPVIIDTLIQKAHQLPKSPGVYRFLNQKGLPVYIGKSINIRQRVLSHLYQANTCQKENRLAHATTDFSVSITEGEISALLLESTEVKKYLPLFNRKLRKNKSLFTWCLDQSSEYHSLHITAALWPPENHNQYFGLFKSMTKAKQKLDHFANQHQLCKKLLGLEKAKQHCFGFQLKKCLGACQGLESQQSYNNRLMKALENKRILNWPFQGAIALSEGKSSKQHLIDQWYYLGAREFSEDSPCDSSNQMEKTLLERDTYHIIVNALLKEDPNITIKCLKS